MVTHDSKIMETFVKSMRGRESEVKRFEIKYTVGIACHSSIKSVDHYTEIISEATKGHTLENVKIHRTKCSAVLKNVVSASILEKLTIGLQSSKYSLLIDESTDISGMKHLCLCVKFFSEKRSCIKTEFLA